MQGTVFVYVICLGLLALTNLMMTGDCGLT